MQVEFFHLKMMFHDVARCGQTKRPVHPVLVDGDFVYLVLPCSCRESSLVFTLAISLRSNLLVSSSFCWRRLKFVYDSEKPTPNLYNQLLNEIQKGVQLKRTKCNDRSRPFLQGLSSQQFVEKILKILFINLYFYKL